MPGAAATAVAFFNDHYRVDAAAMSSLLSVALSRGGDFAELFFEHRDEQLHRVGGPAREVPPPATSVQGLGIRVVKGDAIGYAYTESLDLDRDAPRGRYRLAHRPMAERNVRADRCHAHALAVASSSYGFRGAPQRGTSSRRKVALLERADRAARAYDTSDRPRRCQHRRRAEVRDGRPQRWPRHRRRPADSSGCNVTALSRQDGESRQVARTGGGGRLGIEYFER